MWEACSRALWKINRGNDTRKEMKDKALCSFYHWTLLLLLGVSRLDHTFPFTNWRHVVTTKLPQFSSVLKKTELIVVMFFVKCEIFKILIWQPCLVSLLKFPVSPSTMTISSWQWERVNLTRSEMIIYAELWKDAICTEYFGLIFLCRYSAINTKRWHIWQQIRWWWWWMASAATPGISGGSTSGAWSTPRPPTSLHPSYLSLSSLSPSLFRGLSLASYLAPQRTVSANKGRLP